MVMWCTVIDDGLNKYLEEVRDFFFFFFFSFGVCEEGTGKRKHVMF